MALVVDASLAAAWFLPDEQNDVTMDCRFAEVVTLEELGTGRTAFHVELGERQATERIEFDYRFDPEMRVPDPAF